MGRMTQIPLFCLLQNQLFQETAKVQPTSFDRIAKKNYDFMEWRIVSEQIITHIVNTEKCNAKYVTYL